MWIEDKTFHITRFMRLMKVQKSAAPTMFMQAIEKQVPKVSTIRFNPFLIFALIKTILQECSQICMIPAAGNASGALGSWQSERVGLPGAHNDGGLLQWCCSGDRGAPSAPLGPGAWHLWRSNPHLVVPTASVCSDAVRMAQCHTRCESQSTHIDRPPCLLPALLALCAFITWPSLRKISFLLK